MPRPDEFAAFLVDNTELGVVSCAVGSSGLQGHVSNVSTDPRRRRLGHARACLDALLAWFEQETRVRWSVSTPPGTGQVCTSRSGSRRPGTTPLCSCGRPGRRSERLPVASVRRIAGHPPAAEPSAAAQPYDRLLQGSSSAERASSATADGTASDVAGAAAGLSA
ncbi:hypothetical protein [Streptomyces brevispora]|uniref:hypothetical protein n=1 Tax=Streptomyces brevispora TaxID=887462 RepID=UPI00398D270A